MGWLPTLVLVVVGLVLLAAAVPRVVSAQRRARSAAAALRTSVTGRTARIKAGLAELRAWRASHRSSQRDGELNTVGNTGGAAGVDA